MDIKLKATLLVVMEDSVPQLPLVCIVCQLCKASFYWAKRIVPPRYCPLCGATHIQK